MADSTILNLPASGVLDGTETVPIVQGGTTKRTTINSLLGVGIESLVVVKAASDLSGVLDSTKEYFLDGLIDMGTTSVEVPAGGLHMSSYNFEIAGLYSTENNYSMFTSPVGGSGNVLFQDMLFEVTGSNSQVYDLVGDTGFEAIEVDRINYNNCTSLGTILNYRQGLEEGTGRFGGTPTLTLDGVWVGGFRITTSIVRNLSAGMTEPLFKAGATFQMSSRFLTDINCDLPASAALLDFSQANFPNPSTLQLNGAIITRDGVTNPLDSNISPNISKADLASSWTNNVGAENTFVGGMANVSSEVTTSIATQGVFYDLAGTYTTSDLQHFDSPANGQLRHTGLDPRSYKITSDLVIRNTAGEVLLIKVVKWDNSASMFVDVATQERLVNSLSGPRDVAFFNMITTVDLDQNDYVKLQVANASGNADVIAEVDSFFLVEQR